MLVTAMYLFAEWPLPTTVDCTGWRIIFQDTLGQHLKDAVRVRLVQDQEVKDRELSPSMRGPSALQVSTEPTESNSQGLILRHKRMVDQVNFAHASCDLLHAVIARSSLQLADDKSHNAKQMKLHFDQQKMLENMLDQAPNNFSEMRSALIVATVREELRSKSSALAPLQRTHRILETRSRAVAAASNRAQQVKDKRQSELEDLQAQGRKMKESLRSMLAQLDNSMP